MIVSKTNTAEVQQTQQTTQSATVLTTEQELVKMNPIAEAYKAVRTILADLHVDESDPNSAPLFRTIKMDNGQLSRIKNNKHNLEYGIAFPAVFIHFIDVYYNVGQSSIGEGKGVMRIHYILNNLNNSDDEVELEGMKVFHRIVSAINARKADFPALVTRFQLQYWDQPLTFDDAVQPYWIDYQIWFNDYSGYRYKDYVETYIVEPPFTNHSDQLASSNPKGHSDHKDVSYDDVSGLSIPSTAVNYPSQNGLLIYDGELKTPMWKGDLEKLNLISCVPQTNAGLYKAQFQPKDSYCWPDGSRTFAEINWMIGKASQHFEVEYDHSWCGAYGDTLVIDINDICGDGDIIASSSNENVATVALLDDNIVITGVALGDVTISILKKETDNYSKMERSVKLSMVDIAYIGASSGEVELVDMSSKAPIADGAVMSVTSSISDAKKCHWVAVPTSLGVSAPGVEDGNGEDISFSLKSKVIGDYTVYYILSDMYIGNTTNFIFAE